MQYLTWMKRAGVAALVLVSVAGCRGASEPDENTTAGAMPTQEPFTPNQQLGVDLVTKFQDNEALRGLSISVGTSPETITLDGKVRTAEQKQAAERLAEQSASGRKIVNRLEVDSTLPAPTRPPSPTQAPAQAKPSPTS